MNAFCWQHGAQKYSLHKLFFLPVNKNSVCWTPKPDCKNSTYCSASYFFPLWHTSFFLNNPEAGKWTLSTVIHFPFPPSRSFGLPCMQAINALNICAWLMMMAIKMLAQQDVYKALSVQFLSFYFAPIFPQRPSNAVPHLFSESYFLTVICVARVPVSIAIGYYWDVGRYSPSKFQLFLTPCIIVLHFNKIVQ